MHNGFNTVCTLALFGPTPFRGGGDLSTFLQRKVQMTKKLTFVLAGLFALILIWSISNAFTGKRQEDLTDPSSLSNEIPEEFVLFTMPKTGTHLMRPLLEYLTGKNTVSYWSKEIDFHKSYLYDKNMTDLLLLLPNVVQAYWLHQPIPKASFASVLDHLHYTDDILVTHAPFSNEMENSLKERNTIVFFLIRDPRDWVISVIKHPPVSGVDIYGSPAGDRHFQTLDFNQKIDYVIDGTPKYYSTLEVFNKFLGWRKSPVCCPLRFEALLGPRGGTYSEKEQIIELRKLANALHLDVSDEYLLEAFDASFGKGTVFSKGKAAAWREYFTEEHKDHFKEVLGDLLIELGYENDYNW